MIFQFIKNFWCRFTSGSINRKIFGTAIVISVLTVLVKAVATIKELAVAARFGTGDALDAFLIATLLPTFFSSVIANSFNAALVPTYIQIRESNGPGAAQQLFLKIFTATLILFAGLTILLVIGGPSYLPWIAHGFSISKLQLTYRLLLLTSPFLFLSGMVTILTAVLNAEERFSFPSITPVITPSVTLLFLVFFSQIGIFSLVIGLISGLMIEIFLLGLALRKSRVPFRLYWGQFDSHFWQVLRQFFPMIAGAFIMSSTGLVDQVMAAMLPSGSVAALSYSSKLIAFPLGLVATSLGTSVIPHFSKMVTAGDWAGIRHTLSRYLWIIFLCSVPLLIFLFVLAKPLVYSLFQRGEFNAQNTILVAKIFSFHVLQIPFYIGGILVVRMISSFKANHILMWGAVINFILNVSLNYIFMRFMGVAGIALSTSCVYVISFFFVLMCCVQLVKKNEKHRQSR